MDSNDIITSTQEIKQKLNNHNITLITTTIIITPLPINDLITKHIQHHYIIKAILKHNKTITT